MAKKHKSQQLGVKWETAEPFKLEIKTAPDGEKIVSEAEQLEADRHVAEMLQRQMI